MWGPSATRRWDYSCIMRSNQPVSWKEGRKKDAPVVTSTRVEEHCTVGGELGVRRGGHIQPDRDAIRAHNPLHLVALRRGLAVRERHKARCRFEREAAQQRSVERGLGVVLERENVGCDDDGALHHDEPARGDVVLSEHAETVLPFFARLDGECHAVWGCGAWRGDWSGEKVFHTDVEESGGLVGPGRVADVVHAVRPVAEVPGEVEVR